MGLGAELVRDSLVTRASILLGDDTDIRRYSKIKRTADAVRQIAINSTGMRMRRSR